MTTNDILNWLRTDYAPLVYSQPDDTILQNITNVIRYWNTHSAYPRLQMYPSPSTSVQIDPHFKNVTYIYPNLQQSQVALADPTWTLLGVQVMNYLSADLIAINEGYKGYQTYFGTDFKWYFVQSDDPTVGGTIYLQNVSFMAARMAVLGTMRILPGDDIVAESILEWVLAGCKAQTRMIEGNLLRKADIIGIRNDGQQMIEESKQEWTDLKEQLAKEGRWLSLATRI